MWPWCGQVSHIRQPGTERWPTESVGLPREALAKPGPVEEVATNGPFQRRHGHELRWCGFGLFMVSSTFSTNSFKRQKTTQPPCSLVIAGHDLATHLLSHLLGKNSASSCSRELLIQPCSSGNSRGTWCFSAGGNKACQRLHPSCVTQPSRNSQQLLHNPYSSDWEGREADREDDPRSH